MNKFSFLFIFLFQNLFGVISDLPIETWEQFTKCFENQGPTQAFGAALPMTDVMKSWRKESYIDEDNSLLRVLDAQSKVQKILEAEAYYSPDFHVVYHGSNGWRLISDTIEALYETYLGVILPRDFVMLRDPFDPDIGNELAEDLVRQEFSWKLPRAAQRQLLEWLEITAIACEGELTALSDEEVDLLWNAMEVTQPRVQCLRGWELPASLQTVLKKLHDPLQSVREKDPLSWLTIQYWLLQKAAEENSEKSIVSPLFWRIEKQWESVLEALQMSDTDFNTYLAFRVDSIRPLIQKSSYAPSLDPHRLKKSDHAPAIAKRLLAVNLSLFGGCAWNIDGRIIPGFFGECTPIYWTSPSMGGYWDPANRHNRTKLMEAVLKPILERFNIPESEIGHLITIYDNYLTAQDDQRLFQILIPKEGNLIDKVMYLSWEKGYPASLAGAENVSKTLDIYRKDASQLLGVQHLQGRLVFSQFLLYPESGIRWITYLADGASEDRIEAYRSELRLWARSWLK